MTHLMPNVLRHLFTASLLIFVSGLASAGTPVAYRDGAAALFQIEAPDFWNVRTGGQRTLTAPDTGEERLVSRVMGLSPVSEKRIWVGFVSPHGVGTLDEASEYLQDIGPFLVQDTTIGKRVTRRINGLLTKTVAGTGKRKGKKVDFTVVMIDLPNNRVAIGVVVFEAGADLSPVNDINDMLLSFKAFR